MSLENRLVEPLARDWASCDKLGEAGGPLYVAVRLSLSCPPWKVLRLAVPRGNRSRSGGVTPLLTLWVEAPPPDLGGGLVPELLSLPFWTTEGLPSAEFLSVQTYVFLLVMLDEPLVDVAGVLLRSGMSDTLGLLAFPSRGLPPSTGRDFLFAPPTSCFTSFSVDAAV